MPRASDIAQGEAYRKKKKEDTLTNQQAIQKRMDEESGYTRQQQQKTLTEEPKQKVKTSYLDSVGAVEQSVDPLKNTNTAPPSPLVQPQQAQEQTGFLNSVAKFGLAPASGLTNLALRTDEFLTGKESGSLGKSTPEDILARHPTFGKVAGITTAVGSTAELAITAYAGITALATKLIASRGMSGLSVAKAASGSLDDIDRFGRATVNTKTAKAVSDYLWSLARYAKKPAVAYGIVATGFFTSMFWAGDTKANSLTTLSVLQRDALIAKDYDTVYEVGEDIAEANDIADKIPVSGFLKSENAGWNAVVDGSAFRVKQAQEAQQKAEQLKIKAEADQEAGITPVTEEPKQKEQKWNLVDGKYKPNLNNKLWIKKGSKNVWTG